MTSRTGLRGGAYAAPIDVEIAPEPTEAERAAIVAAVEGPADGVPDGGPSPWTRAGLEEAVGADDAYAPAPSL